MKTIIAGSRRFPKLNINEFKDWNDKRNELFVKKIEIIVKKINLPITMVVSGNCYGIDHIGELYANKHNIPLKLFPANWKIGKHAGFLRNQEMADFADALIVIMSENSSGSNHMVEIFKKTNKPFYQEIL